MAMKEVRKANGSVFGKFMSYAGWGIGLASLLIAIYGEFLKKDEPKLEYDIVSSAKFINNNETSASLKIFVDSLDVQENHLNITAYNIKVENKGTEHIRYDDYDKGDFGLRITNGKLLEPPVLLESSTEHIRSQYSERDSLSDNRFIAIPQLSLDVNDYYIMRVVLLHGVDSIPSFTPEGKIVGQKEIVFQSLQQPVPGFWSEVFHGVWYVHIVRFFVYIFGIAFLGLLFGFVVSSISDKLSKYKRKRYMNELAKKKKLVQFVRDDYVNNGEFTIIQMNELYKKSESDITTKYKKSKGFVKSTRAWEKSNRKAVRYHKDRYQKICRMIDSGYLVLKDDDNIAFNKDAKQTVHDIYTMLDSRDLLSRLHDRGHYYEHIVIDPLSGELLSTHMLSDTSL